MRRRVKGGKSKGFAVVATMALVFMFLAIGAAFIRNSQIQKASLRSITEGDRAMMYVNSLLEPVAKIITNGSNTFSWTPTAGAQFDGTPIQMLDVNSAALAKEYGVAKLGASSFMLERPFTYGPEDRGVLSLACVDNCLGVSKVKTWVVKGLVVCGTAAHQKMEVILSRKGSGGLWGATTTADFPARSTISVGLEPQTVVVADVNNDGNLDLMSLDTHNNSVSVSLGNGDGTFQAKTSYTTGVTPRHLEATDLNGDGKLDFISADAEWGENTVSVLMGNGDGTFQPRNIIPAGTRPYAVTASDLNGDGKPDLMIADTFSNTVSITLGNGDGTFQARTTIPAGTNPWSIITKDINGDGKADIVTADYDFYQVGGGNTLSLYFGNGDGTFQPRTTVPTEAAPYLVTAVDVNGDGKLDLVNTAGWGGTAGVDVILGNGDGTFQPKTLVHTGESPNWVVAKDINGDGKIDLVVTTDDNTVETALGNGDGTFQPRTILPGGGYPRGLAVADINKDGAEDLLTADTYADPSAGGTDTVSIYLGVPAFSAKQITVASKTY